MGDKYSLAIQEAASKILKRLGSESNPVDRVFPMANFSAEVSKILEAHDGLAESDLHILLTYLARDKSAIVYDLEVSLFPPERML